MEDAPPAALAAPPPSERMRARRLHTRGAYDRATIDAILDAMPVCHVGYVFDGAPFVTPTLQWREGDHVYWHGSAASRMLETSDGAEVCLTVTIVDGFVAARTAFNHSVNYRSVMLVGRAHRVSDPEEKARKLKTFTDGLFPGRWDMLRPATVQELKATSVLGMRIEEASAKIRRGPPGDDAEDLAWPVWAGVIPVRMQVGTAEADPRLDPAIQPAPHIPAFRLG